MPHLSSRPKCSSRWDSSACRRLASCSALLSVLCAVSVFLQARHAVRPLDAGLLHVSACGRAAEFDGGGPRCASRRLQPQLRQSSRSKGALPEAAVQAWKAQQCRRLSAPSRPTRCAEGMQQADERTTGCAAGGAGRAQSPGAASAATAPPALAGRPLAAQAQPAAAASSCAQTLISSLASSDSERHCAVCAHTIPGMQLHAASPESR